MIHLFFFSAIQCDEEFEMVIFFFWVDARSGIIYQQFGYVITFDTTYIKPIHINLLL